MRDSPIVFFGFSGNISDTFWPSTKIRNRAQMVITQAHYRGAPGERFLRPSGDSSPEGSGVDHAFLL
jgi:hypothetical protein